ncbi:MAG: c-type cytochrome [Croceibacterium sp.]
MKFAVTGATALTLALALAACGGNDQAADSAAVADTTVVTPVATDSATPLPAETATPTPSPTPTPSATTVTPTPTPTPKPTASAKPTPVAMATKPAEFAQCSACHSTEPGKNGIGPSLAGIYGDKAATVPGYDFSDAMKSSGLTWNQATLDRYLTDPKGVVPGTKMTFAGVKDAAKRKAIIDYLKSL